MWQWRPNVIAVSRSDRLMGLSPDLPDSWLSD
jgi:hypothetical protein